MFIQPTTLILGAGASWHYGYPTGASLNANIISFSGAPNNSQYEGYRQLYRALVNQGSPVIDYFLSQNPSLAEDGMYCIAREILEVDQRIGEMNVEHLRGTRQDDWVSFVIAKLSQDCSGIDHLFENQFRVITFNYDISLERRLFIGLSSIEIFKDHRDKIINFINERTIHVYGRVRDDFHVSLSGVGIDSYAETITKQKRLNLIYPKDSKLPHAIDEKVKSILLSNTNRLFIFGYGFDENNSRLIHLNELERGRASLSVTNMGNLSAVSIKMRYLPAFYNNHDIDVSGRSVYEALEKDFVL